MTVLSLASTGTVVSSPCRRSAASTCRRISSMSGARLAAQAPTQGRHVELDALAGIGLALAVERLVLAKLGVKDHCQQACPGPRPGDDVEWRGRLGDLLA